MKTTKTVFTAIAGVLLSAQAVTVMAASEQDSPYRWGRWAVLSPAAGGSEPFVAAVEPGATNNALPGEWDNPSVTESVSVSPPVVVPNPPGNPAPPGDPRQSVIEPPVVVPNPGGTAPPTGDPRS